MKYRVVGDGKVEAKVYKVSEQGGKCDGMSKQRLIDANTLMETYKGWLPQLTAEEDAGGRNGVETCIAVLEDAPTIDAIPVAWLRTQINEALDDNETELASDIDWLIRRYINEQEAR